MSLVCSASLYFTKNYVKTLLTKYPYKNIKTHHVGNATIVLAIDSSSNAVYRFISKNSIAKKSDEKAKVVKNLSQKGVIKMLIHMYKLVMNYLVSNIVL